MNHRCLRLCLTHVITRNILEGMAEKKNIAVKREKNALGEKGARDDKIKRDKVTNVSQCLFSHFMLVH